MADYLEGDLGLDKRALFDAHLDECPECAGEIEGVRGTIALLRSLPDPELPDAFGSQVMARIREQEAEMRPWSERLGRLAAFFSAPRVLAPLSVSLIVAGLVLGTGQVEDLIYLDAETTGIAHRSQPTERVLAGLPGLVGRQTTRAGASFPLLVIRQEPVLEDLPGPVRTSPRPLMALSPGLLAQRSGSPGGARAGMGGSWGRSERAAGSFHPYSNPSSMREMPVPGSLVSLNSSGGRSPAPSEWEHPGQQPSADDWLNRLLEDPAVFATGLGNTSLAEQELWVEHLARRARQRGDLDRIVRALRTSASPRARLLAEDFLASSRGKSIADQSSSGYRD